MEGVPLYFASSLSKGGKAKAPQEANKVRKFLGSVLIGWITIDPTVAEACEMAWSPRVWRAAAAMTSI